MPESSIHNGRPAPSPHAQTQTQSQSESQSQSLSVSVSGSTMRPESPTGSNVSRRSTHADTAEEPNAVELQHLSAQSDTELDDLSSNSLSSSEYRIVARRTITRSTTSEVPRKGLWGDICRLWTHNVVLTVPQKSNRDHFALERTFLAYIRTSVTVAMQGVLIAQLFRLRYSPTDQGSLTYFDVGIPLAVTCHCVAILIALMGAHRFWTQQSNVASGKVRAGGWELNGIGLLVGLLNLAVFILTIIVMATGHY